MVEEREGGKGEKREGIEQSAELSRGGRESDVLEADFGCSFRHERSAAQEPRPKDCKVRRLRSLAKRWTGRI